MNKDFLIQLTSNLYRLTLLFPKKEPLRYKMRDLASSILIQPSEKEIEALNSFFEVAKTQNWVSPFDVLAIQKEYDSLKEELRQISSRTPQIFPDNSEKGPGNLDNGVAAVEVAFQASGAPILERNERQERILAFLRENGRAQVWNVKQVFPEVTKRTLRRDFEQMLGQGIIERIGEKNNTFYQVKTFNA